MVIYHIVTWFNVATKCCFLSHGLLKPLGVVIYHMVTWFNGAIKCGYISHSDMVYGNHQMWLFITW